ncbi:TetR/AcrR family transcriptional regulator [Saccharopolyspora sp. 5N102]|uniref:TetR/AcrR family transcriptional regulator n=1 Tax=Saccharopolyspora sp. 5N102 TaxID=3375155 RepID=UPI00379BD51D
MREQLLDGAKQCLAERGYARTTVRDIVAVSGTNLAAINYHFGSKDALLNEAMIESAGDAVREILEAGEHGDEPSTRLRAFLSSLTESFTNNRGTWATNIEALAQALHTPELRARIVAGQAEARAGLVDVLPAPDDDRTRRAIGAVQLTLLSGLLVQWMADPEGAPRADEVVDGLLALAETLGGPAAT